MRHEIRRLLAAALLAAALLLASCADMAHDSLTAQLRHYEAYAGKPVPQIRWINGYKRWSAIGKDKLLVWTNIDQPYLVTVYRPCTNLLFARIIGVTSTVDIVQPRFNFVLADGWRCMISTIQPIDYARMQRDERRGHAAPSGTHQR